METQILIAIATEKILAYTRMKNHKVGHAWGQKHRFPASNHQNEKDKEGIKHKERMNPLENMTPSS